MNFKIIIIPETGYGANCYIVYSEDTKKAVVIDPGVELKVIEDYIEKNKLEVEKILLTHGHADHIGTLQDLKTKLQVPILAHKDELELLRDGSLNFSIQMFAKEISIDIDEALEDKDLIKIEDLEFEVIHTPGHTPGGVCYKIGNYLITGDTLFQGSIGRTDFPGGSFEEIIDSIKSKLLVLDESTTILPGHGPHSTIAYEKQYNPFLR